MDLQFMKFWTDAIKQSAAVQTLSDEVSRWMKGEIKETDELYALFRKYYGLEQGSAVFADYETQLKEMAGNFQKSFKEFLSVMGVIPKSEYDLLHEQYEELKKKVMGLEKTLKDLEKQISGNAADQPKNAGALDEMIKAQTDQFQKIMTAFAEISGITSPKGK